MGAAQGGRLQKAFYGSITSAIQQIVVLVCGFITSRMIIEAFGSSWNGVVSAAGRYLAIFYIVEMGVNGATRVALYRSLAQNDMAQTSAIMRANDLFYRKVACGLTAYVALLAAVLPFILDSGHSTLGVAAMVTIVGLSAFAEHCWGINARILLTASQNVYIANIIKTCATILNMIALFIIIKAGGNIFNAKIGSGFVYTLAPIAMFIVSRRMFKLDRNVEPDYSALKNRWNVMANSIANIVHENVGLIVLSFFVSTNEISVFTMYFAIAAGLTRVFYVISNGVEAAFGNLWNKGEKEVLELNLQRFEYLLCAVAIVLFGCMIALIVPFMSIFIRVTDADYNRFSLGVVMAVSQLIMSIRNPYVLLVQAVGRYKETRNGAFAEAGINLVLTLFFVSRYGIIGAMIGMGAANLFRTIQYGYYASKHILYKPFSLVMKRIVWTFVTFGISTFASVLFVNRFFTGTWLSWWIVAVVTFAIQVSFLLVASLWFYRSNLLGCVELVKRLARR